MKRCVPPNLKYESKDVPLYEDVSTAIVAHGQQRTSMEAHGKSCEATAPAGEIKNCEEQDFWKLCSGSLTPENRSKMRLANFSLNHPRKKADNILIYICIDNII